MPQSLQRTSLETRAKQAGQVTVSPEATASLWGGGAAERDFLRPQASQIAPREASPHQGQLELSSATGVRSPPLRSRPPPGPAPCPPAAGAPAGAAGRGRAAARSRPPPPPGG